MNNTMAPPIPPVLTPSADGWRGPGGEQFEQTVYGLSVAIGEELRARYGPARVVVTHDCRRDSQHAARVVAGALTQAGMEPVPAGALPTPVANFALARLGCVAAIIVTASHNGAESNGIKLKVAPGRPPDAKLEAAIECRRLSLGHTPPPPPSTLMDARSDTLCEEFRRSVACLVPEAASAGLTVVVEGLHGVAGPLLADLLHGVGCRVLLVGGEADPSFAGLEPNPMSARSRRRLVSLVRRTRADLGFVVDGDGDRLGVVDAHSRFHWPHDVMAAILDSGVVERHDTAGVAHTVATGSIVGRTATARGQPTFETPVGFKHIAPFLESGQAFAGSGGVGDIGFKDGGCDRNPFHAALLVVAALRMARLPFAALVEQLHRRHGHSFYSECDLPIATLDDAEQVERIGMRALWRAGLADALTDVRRLDGVKFCLGGRGWLLLRRATTAPAVRALVETSAPGDLATLVESLVHGTRSRR